MTGIAGVSIACGRFLTGFVVLKDYNMEIAESAEVAAGSTDILRELCVLRVKVFTEPQQSTKPVEISPRLKNRGIHLLGSEKTLKM